jgi:hypothetical protein
MPNLQLSSEEVAHILGYLEEEDRILRAHSAAQVKNAAVP